MENFKKRAIDLVLGLAITEDKVPSVIPYEPSKTWVSSNEHKYFKRRIGGKNKKYTKILSDMLVALEREKRANVHNIMVLQDGEVICEASYPGYDVNTAHLAHSMSKTVTAIGIGILIDEGKLSLDTPIVDIFPDMSYSDERFPLITVEHLLTMQSGVPFSELGVVTEFNWTAAFFSSKLKFDPGTEFAYNSMNSYILAEAITRITNMSLTEYLESRLFAPLGITNYFWEVSHEHIEKGGFGLYMSCESFAKIGMLLLDNGVFNGKRIVSEDWVKRSTAEHSKAPEDKGSFNYGYHIWVSRTGDSFGLNGMLGQNVWICPKNRIVVSLNAGNNEVFQDSPALLTIMKFLSVLPERRENIKRSDFRVLKYIQSHFCEHRHWIRPLKPERGLAHLLGLRERRPFDTMWNDMLGTYAFPDNNTGILPLFVRVMQNNYLGGIDSFELRREDDQLIFVSREGGIAYEFPIGLYGYKETVMNYDGEHYIVRAFGEAMEDEDRNPVYKIEFIFPELPNTRMIKLTRVGNKLRVRMSETPNQRIADTLVTTVTQGGTIGFAMGIIEKRAGEDFIERKLHGAFNPELYGIDTRTEGWENIIAAENQIIAEKHEKSGKLVKSMVNKFIGSDKDVEVQKEKAKGESFLKRAFGAMRAIKRKMSSSDVKVKEYVELTVDDADTPLLTAPTETPASAEPVSDITEAVPEENSAKEFITVLDEDGEVCIVPAVETGDEQSTEVSES